MKLTSSNEKAEECFYRLTFKGNAIEVFANKSHNHGKVKYRVDDGAETLVDLYDELHNETQRFSLLNKEKEVIQDLYQIVSSLR